MTKKVSFKIADDSYKELVSLGDFYKQDVEDVIAGILDITGHQAHRIIELGKEYKVPVKLTAVMAHTFAAGFDFMQLFHKVLEDFEAKGLYTLEDFDFDLDKNYLWFYFAALIGCNLQIDAFCISTEPGLSTLTTWSYIDARGVNKKGLEKLKKLVQSVEVPEEFEEVDDYHIEIDEEDEESLTLTIDCAAEGLGYLPSVKEASKFVEHILRKAEIKYEKVKS